MDKSIFALLLILSITFGSAVLIDNPNIPLVSRAPTATGANSSNFWNTTDLGPISAAGQIPHNILSGLQGGAPGEFYHLTGAQQGYIAINLFDFLLEVNLTTALANFHDQDLNTTDNVTTLKH